MISVASGPGIFDCPCGVRYLEREPTNTEIMKFVNSRSLPKGEVRCNVCEEVYESAHYRSCPQCCINSGREVSEVYISPVTPTPELTAEKNRCRCGESIIWEGDTLCSSCQRIINQGQTFGEQL